MRMQRKTTFLIFLVLVAVITTLLSLFTIESYMLKIELYVGALLVLFLAISLLMSDNALVARRFVSAFFIGCFFNALYLMNKVPEAEQKLPFILLIASLVGLLSCGSKKSCGVHCACGPEVEVYSKIAEAKEPAYMEEAYVDIQDLKKDMPKKAVTKKLPAKKTSKRKPVKKATTKRKAKKVTKKKSTKKKAAKKRVGKKKSTKKRSSKRKR